MKFQIKAFKSWQTDDGGGYQFNLYLDGYWNSVIYQLKTGSPEFEDFFNRFLLAAVKWHLPYGRWSTNKKMSSKTLYSRQQQLQDVLTVCESEARLNRVLQDTRNT